MELKNKNTFVIGMGRTGIATANFLAARGAHVTLCDSKSQPQFSEEYFEKLDSSVKRVFGDIAHPKNSELIVVSPGVDMAEPSLEQARSENIEVISEIELACRFTTVPIIAVTGTNGKSTTTTLIGNILQQAGLDVRVGGNIGVPFISLLDQSPKDYFVLEISSFQLEGVKHFNPRIAAILNITPDHLDRHKTMEAYVELKHRLADNQTQEDFLVLNFDDPLVKNLWREKQSNAVFFSAENKLAKGAFLKANKIYFNHKAICSLDDLPQVMRWQVENVLAALTVCSLADVEPRLAVSAVKHFKGLEHRLEWVRDVEGVKFVNDSKSTNVGSTQKSLASFDQPIVLIAGGQDKGSDFSVLKPLLKEKVKHLVLIGEAKTKFQPVLNGSFSYDEADNLKEAIDKALQNTSPGDVVLLSPACASFDMFKNFEDRGNQFKSIVLEL